MAIVDDPIAESVLFSQKLDSILLITYVVKCT